MPPGTCPRVSPLGTAITAIGGQAPLWIPYLSVAFCTATSPLGWRHFADLGSLQAAANRAGRSARGTWSYSSIWALSSGKPHI